MDLAEAILLGLPEIEFTNRQWLQPGRRGLLFGDRRCTGCLLGAGLFSVGERRSITILEVRNAILQHWPYFNRPVFFACPVCGLDGSDPIEDVLTHLAMHYESKFISVASIAKIVRGIEAEAKAAYKPREEKKNGVSRSHTVRVA